MSHVPMCIFQTFRWEMGASWEPVNPGPGGEGCPTGRPACSSSSYLPCCPWDFLPMPQPQGPLYLYLRSGISLATSMGASNYPLSPLPASSSPPLGGEGKRTHSLSHLCVCCGGSPEPGIGMSCSRDSSLGSKVPHCIWKSRPSLEGSGWQP